MRNRTEVEIDRGQVSYADPGFFVRLDHQANIPANAGGVVLILNLSVPARQQVSNSRLLAQISQHHVHAAAHRQPIINPVVDGGNKRQAEDGRSLEKVPADPVQVVLQSAAEIVTHGEAEFKPAVQAVNIKEAAGGQRNQRVAAVGSPRRRACVGCEIKMGVNRLNAGQKLRMIEQSHPGWIAEHSGGVLRARAVAGAGEPHVRGAHLVQEEAAGQSRTRPPCHQQRDGERAEPDDTAGPHELHPGHSSSPLRRLLSEFHPRQYYRYLKLQNELWSLRIELAVSYPLADD